MRLRRGKTPRNVADAEAIVVTHNSLFAHSSRRHLYSEGILPPRTIGPVLTVGQMTTVRDALVQDMTRSQISEAQRRAQNWLEDHGSVE